MRLEQFDSRFPDGSDPSVRRRRVEYELKQLAVADVDVKVGDVTKKSSELFAADDHADVLAFLWSIHKPDIDQRNDLGCARAWAWSWDEAESVFNEINKDGTASDDQKTRATSNLAVVAKAKAAAGT